MGYTDRVVRAFRWEESSEGSDQGSGGQLVLLKKWLLEGQVCCSLYIFIVLHLINKKKNKIVVHIDLYNKYNVQSLRKISV